MGSPLFPSLGLVVAEDPSLTERLSGLLLEALPALVVEDHMALHHKLKQTTKSFDQPPYRSFNSIVGNGNSYREFKPDIGKPQNYLKH